MSTLNWLTPRLFNRGGTIWGSNVHYFNLFRDPQMNRPWFIHRALRLHVNTFRFEGIELEKRLRWKIWKIVWRFSSILAPVGRWSHESEKTRDIHGYKSRDPEMSSVQNQAFNSIDHQLSSSYTSICLRLWNTIFGLQTRLTWCDPNTGSPSCGHPSHPPNARLGAELQRPAVRVGIRPSMLGFLDDTK